MDIEDLWGGLLPVVRKQIQQMEILQQHDLPGWKSCNNMTYQLLSSVTGTS